MQSSNDSPLIHQELLHQGLFLLNRKSHNEATPFFFVIHNRNSSFMNLHNMFYNGKAKPSSAGISASVIINPVETLKYSQVVFPGNADSKVCKTDKNIIV